MRTFLLIAVAGFLLIQMACQDKGQTTEHGFRFINHTKKDGPKPQPGETIMVQTYTFVGDSMMASTLKNFGGPREYNLPLPEEVEKAKKIPALYDAALLMAEGDSATIYETIDTFLQKYIPPTLKDAKEVRYEIVLVDIVSKEEMAQKEQEAAAAAAAAQARVPAVQAEVNAVVKDYAAGKLKDRLITLPSGLKMLVLEKGNGDPVKTGDTVKTDYFGVLPDGTMFDNSYQRGEAYQWAVGVGQMIPGFDEGTQQLNHGGKAYFFIPYDLAYGEEGNPPVIPAKTELIFYVEVL
jgi:FKBP-type peptidyl-prolyl cis-trans isomerase